MFIFVGKLHRRPFIFKFSVQDIVSIYFILYNFVLLLD
jgi:hypothetical protein